MLHSRNSRKLLIANILRHTVYRTIPSFRRMIARSRSQRPVMTIRTKNNGKARNKNTTCGQEQCHVNGYTLGHLREQNGRPLLQYSCHSNSISLQRGCFMKTPRYKSSKGSTEVIRRHSWPIHYCLEESNQTHTRAHTQTYPATVTLQCMCAEV